MPTDRRRFFHRTRPLLGAAGLALVLSACGGGDPQDEALATQASPRAQHGLSTPAPPSLAPWVPQVGDTWQWQLTGTIDTGYDVKVYDIDLFDTPDAVFGTLHGQGRYVVCYFSAGSAEDWRPDYHQFKPADLGNRLGGWPGERWVDTRSANVRGIMKARLDMAKARGCDGVEPDNVDAYTNKPGLPLTYATQLDYNRFLASEARARGMKVALKNDVDQLADLAPSFDFAVNEQCHQYKECGGYSAFTGAGKPVFNAEYKRTWRDDANARAQMCADARAANLRTLVLPVKLNDAFRYSCD